MSILLILASTVAQADELYCVPGGTDLAIIDTNALTITPIGSTGFSGIGGLALSDTGALYGITSGDDLIEIDTATGVGTLVGNSNRGFNYSTGLSFDPITNQLFGVADHGVGYSSFLVSIDPLTGVATDVGDTSAETIVALGFSATGDLYALEGATGIDSLLILDPASGATTEPTPSSLAAWPNIGGADVGASGTLWAVHQGTTYELLEIDTATGTATKIGDLTGVGLTGNVTGLASAVPFSTDDVDQDGWTTDDGDCDDLDATVYPGAPELCDGLDNDCDGWLGPAEEDLDGDGFIECDECDDSDPDAFPGNPELCDGVDNDCDGVIDPGEVDDDGDGFSECQDDCDDGDPARFFGNPEICDGLDNDCDGSIEPDEVDLDGDGFPPCAGDCDESDPAIHPGATDLPGDAIDQDCDGVDATSSTGTGTGTGGAVDDPKLGCGCNHGTPPAIPWVVGLLLLRVRRRR